MTPEPAHAGSPDLDRRGPLPAPSPRSAALDSLGSCGSFVHCRSGERISSHDNPHDYWYRVISGVVRCCFVLFNGRRQIVDFLLPGDFFAAAGREEDYFCLEAVVDATVVAMYPRLPAEELVDADPGVAKAVRDMAFRTIARSHQQLLVRGQVTATAKVGWFLLNMERRLPRGRRLDEIVLPMSRYDIADYLALSVETVSRALTSLRERRVIALSGARRLRILDRAMLESGERQDVQ